MCSHSSQGDSLRGCTETLSHTFKRVECTSPASSKAAEEVLTLTYRMVHKYFGLEFALVHACTKALVLPACGNGRTKQRATDRQRTGRTKSSARTLGHLFAAGIATDRT